MVETMQSDIPVSHTDAGILGAISWKRELWKTVWWEGIFGGL